MTEIPKMFPFTKLKLEQGEIPVWVGFNPTFHRFFVYGIAISDKALYLCRRAWILANWKRYPLNCISDVMFDSGRSRPTLRFRVGDAKVTFNGPWDLYRGEMQFDRGVISAAAAFLDQAVAGK